MSIKPGKRTITHLRDDVDAQALILLGISEGMTAKAAMTGVGYPWSQLKTLRKENDAFAERYDHAYAEGTDVLEEEAKRRAVEGVPEPVFYLGAVVGHKQKYSDRLLEFLLKARDRERFGDRVKITDAEGALDPAAALAAARLRASQASKARARIESGESTLAEEQARAQHERDGETSERPQSVADVLS